MFDISLVNMIYLDSDPWVMQPFEASAGNS